MLRISARCERRRPAVLAIAVVAALLAQSWGRAGAATSCESLAMLVLPETNITSAAVVPDGTYCRVQGVFAPSDHFEVRLPTTGWNGKFAGVGNLALGGQIEADALSLVVARGYAAAGTDAGHGGGPLDASWALGHPELV